MLKEKLQALQQRDQAWAGAETLENDIRELLDRVDNLPLDFRDKNLIAFLATLVAGDVRWRYAERKELENAGLDT